MQPRYPQQTPNTLGGGYIAGDIPLPSAQPQQQAAAAHAPTAAAPGTPWSFGPMGDIQHTTGGDELSTQLYREVSELETFARDAHAHGIDVTRPDASNPEAMSAFRWFENKKWRLKNLQAQLVQGRKNQEAYQKGVASGQILPSHIDQGMPFGTQQAASALAHQNEIPEVQDYQKRNAGYMSAAAQGHLNPSMRDMAIQDYNRAVASVQARAQQFGHDQSWVQTQVNRLPPPPTESGTTRKVVTQENTQSGWHEALVPKRTGSGIDNAVGIGEDIVRASRGGVQQTKVVGGRPYGFSPVLAGETAGAGRTYTGIYYDPATHLAHMGIADKDGNVTLQPMKYTNGHVDPLATIGQASGINSQIYKNLYNNLSDAGLLHTDPVSGRELASMNVPAAYPGLLREPHHEAHRTMQVAHENNSANIAKFERIRQSGEGSLRLVHGAEYLLSNPTHEYRVRGGILNPTGNGTMDLSGAAQVEQRVFDNKKGKFGDWHETDRADISGMTKFGGFSEHEINDQYIDGGNVGRRQPFAQHFNEPTDQEPQDDTQPDTMDFAP